MDGELDSRGAEMLDPHVDSDDLLKETRDAWAEIGSALRMDAGPLPDASAVEADWLALEALLPPRQQLKSLPASADEKIVRFPWFWVGGFAAMAAAVALSLGVWMHDAGKPAVGPDAFAGFDSDPSISFVETDIPGASSMMYVDESSGWTIVWVTDPLQSNLSTSAS
jgi:hypothetical protein